MSNKDPQSSALLILSPLTARLLDTHAAVIAATTLKQQGVGRADIAMDPRHSFDNRHSHRWALPSFESAARRIADTIFRPMIGHSDVIDFSRATTDEISAPTLSTLSTVGGLFMRAADLFVLHKIEQPLPEMKEQADVLVQACRVTRVALETFPRYRELEPHWVEVNRLENEGDRIYRRAIAGLFDGDHKAMDVLKWRDVIDETEGAIDQLEDVSNMLEAIALKQA